ncbi:MAG: DUF559 domain-containing protein [Elusimicrobia bacterium]|nr:DUF559 domain-containing protein [Elusimicrobiota bacterium]MBP9698898.1 DUF559 domain-containing protein [Elusimicrobiota bacterium]
MSLISLARGLRQTSTDAEQKMWAFLRGRRFSGFKFRRQQPLGPYIVDFLCKDRSLIIELDGGQHQDHVEADAKRTAFFESHGFRVLRFWNHEFLKEPLTVFECVLKEIQNRLPHPGPRISGTAAPGAGRSATGLPRGEGKKPGLFSGEGVV